MGIKTRFNIGDKIFYKDMDGNMKIEIVDSIEIKIKENNTEIFYMTKNDRKVNEGQLL